MANAVYRIGPVSQLLAQLPAGSVDLALTSPPFLALRSYLPADHPDKTLEIGSEATPARFIDTLLDLVEQIDRVLAPHGSLVFELGDTYAGSGGAGGDYSDDGLKADQPAFDGSAKRTRASGERTAEESRLGVDARNRARRGGSAKVARRFDGAPNGDFGTGAAARPARVGRDRNRLSNMPAGPHSAGAGDGWPLDKSLCGIPHAFALSLAYGFNVLTGPERQLAVDDYGNAVTVGRSTPPWRIRNIVVWARPNPPVGALGDKVRPATSYLIVACKSRRRYFDLTAVRRPNSRAAETYTGGRHAPRERDSRTGIQNPDGAPPLDYAWADDDDRFVQDTWEIPTQPYPGAHYATWPEQLVVVPIKAMCPERVCTVCGKPSERIVEMSESYAAARAATGDMMTHKTGSNDRSTGRHGDSRAAQLGAMTAAEYVTTGWTDCGHGAWRSGVVLDPFAGSGTTLQVATGHGRDAIGFDIDARNAALAVGRVGPLLLEVDETPLEPGVSPTPPTDRSIVPPRDRGADTAPEGGGGATVNQPAVSHDNNTDRALGERSVGVDAT